MILRIDPDYRISIDARNFALQRKRKSAKGKAERWRTVGYFKDFQGVLQRASQEKISSLGKCTLHEFSHALHAQTRVMKQIGARLEKALAANSDDRPKSRKIQSLV